MWVQFLGWEDPLEGGYGNPPKYSCLENPRDGEAWWAVVYGVAQSQTRLKRFSSSSSLTLKQDSYFIDNTYHQNTFLYIFHSA